MEKIFNLGTSLSNVSSTKSKELFSSINKMKSSGFKEALNNKVSNKSTVNKSNNANSEETQNKNSTPSETKKNMKNSSVSKSDAGEDDSDTEVATEANTIGNITSSIDDTDPESEISGVVSQANSLGELNEKRNIVDGDDDIDFDLETELDDSGNVDAIRGADKKTDLEVTGALEEILSTKKAKEDNQVNNEVSFADNNALQGKISSDLESQGAVLKNLNVSAEISDPKWGDEFAQKVHVLINVKTKEAKISINPKELGPIKIQIEKSDNDLKVAFNSSTNRVSEVIESNLSKLRDLVENEGMNLLDVSVSSNEKDSNNQDDKSKEDILIGKDSNGSESITEENIVRLNDNIIDFYA